MLRTRTVSRSVVRLVKVLNVLVKSNIVIADSGLTCRFRPIFLSSVSIRLRKMSKRRLINFLGIDKYRECCTRSLPSYLVLTNSRDFVIPFFGIYDNSIAIVAKKKNVF